MQITKDRRSTGYISFFMICVVKEVFYEITHL